MAALAQEPAAETAGDSAQVAGIVFNGVVQDPSFTAGEKLNVEILESGEALQTTVGEPFQVVLPEDTLWNVCVTNSDTAGAEKEKCYELKYVGAERSFSQTLGDAFAEPDSASVGEGEGSPLASAADAASATPSSGDTPQRRHAHVSAEALSGQRPQRPAAGDSSGVILSGAQAESKDPDPNSSAPTDTEQPEDVDVDALLAGGDNNKVTELKKVVVQLRKRPKRKPGESVVSAKSIKRMPGLAEADVIKSVQALPGVVASSDFSSKIYVRGGAADQNLFLFDNAVVYSPVHFFGLFSTFLVEGIDDVQFYKSGFPAQYGNRLSSVLKMDGRAGGQDTVDEWFSKSSIKISTFAAQAHTEGHKGPARWVVAGRTTYIGYMLDLMPPEL